MLNKMNLKYQTSERIEVVKPVNRITFISDFCLKKVILDIGCFDETAFNQKMNTKFWLHGNLIKKSKKIVGIDNSVSIPPEGIKVNGINIFNEDALNISREIIKKENYDVIVAGEFIEHIECPSVFLRNIKKDFFINEKKRYLVISTPNGISFANTLMGILGREMQHKDHLSVFTYKTLNTLFLKMALILGK